MSRILAVILVIAGACARENQPPLVVRHAATEGDAFTRANLVLRNDAPLDYTLPFARRPSRREALALFREACELHDTRACIIAAGLDRGPTAYDRVYQNCLAGDEWSCRALPHDPEHRYTRAPGNLGRTLRGRDDEYASLDAECHQGFFFSCTASSLSVPIPDLEARQAFQDALARDSCRQGIASACLAWGSTLPIAVQHEMAERSCELDRATCNQSPTRSERDGLEIACQYGGEPMFEACLDLSLRYLGGQLHEPVPGRGRALHDWVCKKLLAIGPEVRYATKCFER